MQQLLFSLLFLALGIQPITLWEREQVLIFYFLFSFYFLSFSSKVQLLNWKKKWEEALEVIKLQLIWCIDNDFCWETEEVFAVA